MSIRRRPVKSPLAAARATGLHARPDPLATTSSPRASASEDTYATPRLAGASQAMTDRSLDAYGSAVQGDSFQDDCQDDGDGSWDAEEPTEGTVMPGTHISHSVEEAGGVEKGSGSDVEGTLVRFVNVSSHTDDTFGLKISAFIAFGSTDICIDDIESWPLHLFYLALVYTSNANFTAF
jgi:hypothetical protein